MKRKERAGGRPSGWIVPWLRALLLLTMLGWFSQAHAVIDVNKSFNPVNRAVGQTSTLVITLYNSNVVAATSASVTDTLPAGISVTPVLSNSCGGSASATGTQLLLTGGTVPAATGSVNGSCSISAVVTATSPGTWINIIPRTNVVTSEGNADLDAQATMTVNTLAGVTGSKAVAVDSDLHGGGTRAFVITLNNSNSIALTGVGYTDTLPASLRVGTGGLVSNSCGGSVLDQSGGDGVVNDGDTAIRLTAGTVPAGGSCSVSFVVRPASDAAANNGGVTNSIPANGVTTTQGITNGSAISGTINLRTGAAVGKAFAPSTINQNGLSTLTLTLTNYNLSAITGVNFTDSMPAGVTVQNALSNTCGGTLNTFPATSVVLSGGTIPAVTDPNSSGGASCVITVQVTAAAEGDYVNSVPVGTLGSTPISYNATSATLRVLAPSSVSISKAFNPATTVHTGTSLLTITLNNVGGVNASITSFTDNLLTMGTTAVRIAASPGPTNNCGGTLSAAAGATTISLAGGVIPANGTCQIIVPVQAEPNFNTGGRTNTLPPDSLVTSVGNNENTTTAVLTINSALTASKAFFPATIAPSGSSRLTVTISHANGAVPFTNLSFTDPLPGTAAGTLTVANPANVFNSCGGTITATPGAVSFSLVGGSLSAGASSCLVALDIQAPAGTGANTNSIPVGSITTAEGVVNRSAATATLTRTNTGAAATLNKSFSPTSINGGGVSTLSVFILNTAPGSLALTSVGLTDALPTGMLIASPPAPTFTGTGCTGGSITATPNSSFVTLAGASITAGSSCLLTVQVTGVQDGNLINSIPAGTLTSAQGVTNGAASAATLTVLRNMAITKVFQPGTIAQGSTSTLLITLINTNDVARTGTPTNTFTDNLPTNVSLASSVSTNSCGGSITNGAGGALAVGNTSVRLNGGVFPVNSVCTITLVVTSSVSGTYSNVIPAGAITTIEGSTNPDPAQSTLTVIAAPTIAKSFNPSSVASGQPSTLTFTLTNPNSAALLPAGLTGAGFTDSLPAGVTVTVSGPASGSCVGASGNFLTAGATSVAISGLTLSPASSCSVIFLVSASAPGVYPNVSSGVSTALTPVAGSPSATATLTVLAAPTLSKSFSPSTLLSGGTGTSVLTLTANNPNAVALNLASPGFLDVFPTSPGAMVVANPLVTTNTCGATLVNSGNGALAAGDAGIRSNNGSIAANGSCSISVVVLAPSPGIYLNTGSLNTVNAGSAPAATASFIVLPSADLRVSKTNGVSTLSAGQSTTYTITVSNLGPASGNGTTITDPVAAGLSCTTLSCTAAGGAACPVPPLDIATLQGPGYVIPGLPASGSVNFLLGCTVTATGL